MTCDQDIQKQSAFRGLVAGQVGEIDAKMIARIVARLEALDTANRPEDMRVPGFDFHALKGFRPTRYTVHVNGPWCITFSFDGEDAVAVDFEQYH
jgi:proteic killer suppression protein